MTPDLALRLEQVVAVAATERHEADSRPLMSGDCDNHPIRDGGWNNVKRPIRTTERALNPATMPSLAVGFRWPSIQAERSPG